MDCETNDCRKEKLTCKGCYYEEKNIEILRDCSQMNASERKRTDIDKDILLLREIQSNFKLDEKLNRITCGIYSDVTKRFIYAHMIENSIENVLKELEELRKYDIRNIELKNGGIEKAPNFTKREIELMNLGIALNETTEKSELETYKKIAEFLAEVLVKHMERYAIKTTKEKLIEDARKEVEKDVL